MPCVDSFPAGMFGWSLHWSWDVHLTCRKPAARNPERPVLMGCRNVCFSLSSKVRRCARRLILRGRACCPKCIPPQNGMTIRSLSHYVAYCPATDLRPEWYSFGADTQEHALNLLLIPWPSRIAPNQLLANRKVLLSDSVKRGAYGLFTFQAAPGPPTNLVKRIIKATEQQVGRIDGIILPELALSRSGADRESSGALGVCRLQRRPGRVQSMAPARPPALKQIDASYLEKYRAVETGTPIDILSCARSWGH